MEQSERVIQQVLLNEAQLSVKCEKWIIKFKQSKFFKSKTWKGKRT
jgi:hypothetical protein